MYITHTYYKFSSRTWPILVGRIPKQQKIKKELVHILWNIDTGAWGIQGELCTSFLTTIIITTIERL